MFKHQPHNPLLRRYRGFCLLFLLPPLLSLAEPTPDLAPTPTPAPTATLIPTGANVDPASGNPLPQAEDRSEPVAAPTANPQGVLFGLPPIPHPDAAVPASPAVQNEREILANPAVQKLPAETGFAQLTLADRIVASISPRAQSNGETLFNGLGGVPAPLSARYLSGGTDQTFGYKVGQAQILPTLQTGFVYILQRGGGGRADYDEEYATISPAVTLLLGTPETGRTLQAQYQGVVSVGNTQERGNYDQSLSVNGTFNFTKLTLGASLQASQLSGADQDFGGGDVDRLLLSVSANAGYLYSEQTHITASLSAPIRLYDEGDSSGGITAQAFLDHVYGPLTTVGVGLGLGTLIVEDHTQVFEQVLIRATYAPNPKFSLNGTTGYEFRNAGEREEITPIFSLGITWQPRDGTSFALSGERSILDSAAMSGTNFSTTSISLTANQRLGRYFDATVSAGYNYDDYEAASSQSTGGRSDQYFLLQAGLSAHLNSRWSVSLNASYSQLMSSVDQSIGFFSPADKASLLGRGGDTLHIFQTSLQLGYAF